MNLQEIFNIVWKWFVVEGNEKSVSETGVCRYRGSNGSKCAIGCLIPDDKYSKDIEGVSVLTLVNRYYSTGIWIKQNLLVSSEILSELQRCHDIIGKTSFSIHIKEGLSVFAQKYSLSIPSIVTIGV